MNIRRYQCAIPCLVALCLACGCNENAPTQPDESICLKIMLQSGGIAYNIGCSSVDLHEGSITYDEHGRRKSYIFNVGCDSLSLRYSGFIQNIVYGPDGSIRSFDYTVNMSTCHQGPPTPVATPVILSEARDVTRHSVRLSWTRNKDANFKRYEIHLSTSASFIPSAVTRRVTIPEQGTISFLLEDLSPNVKYFAKLLVCNTDDITGASNEISFTMQAGGWLLGGTGDEKANDVIVTRDGNAVIVGSTKSTGSGGTDVMLLKVDTSGGILWQRTYGGASDDDGYAVAELADGGFILCGSTRSSGNGESDAYILRTDAMGIVRWEKIFGGAGGDGANDVIVPEEGGSLVVGFSQINTGSSRDGWICRLDAAGGVQWEIRDALGADSYSSVIETGDDNYAVIGTRGGVPGDIMCGKLSRNGSYAFSSALQTSGYPNMDIVRLADGGYLALGTTFGASWKIFPFMIAISPDGKKLWHKTFPGLTNEYFSHGILSKEGDVLMVGTSSGQTGMFLKKFTTGGDPLVGRIFFGPGSRTNGSAVACLPEFGSILVGTASASGRADLDIFILRLDDNCNPR